MALEERRNFLRSTWLCAESLTETTLNRLAKDMPMIRFEAGKQIEASAGWLLVKTGAVELVIGDDVIETLGPGDFSEKRKLSSAVRRYFAFCAREPVEIYLTAADVVRDVPVMRWKLMESHERRMHACVLDSERSDASEVRWRDEYGINIQRIDTHHKNLFVRANTLYKAVVSRGHPP